jgi:lysophospholipase L1-like esterase
MVVLGDSISTGANASRQVAPYMPGYPELVRRQLAAVYASEIHLINLAVGGWNSEQGKAKIAAAAEAAPDLLLVAFGANDLAAKNPAWFAGNIQALLDGVREKCPAAEVILLSEGLTNPEWDWAPVAQFFPYRDALRRLAAAGKSIVVAEVTEIYAAALQRKRYYDFTGNGINHPNDYGHRLYAQVLLSLLVK